VGKPLFIKILRKHISKIPGASEVDNSSIFEIYQQLKYSGGQYCKNTTAYL
jgi:hypothetical protein